MSASTSSRPTRRRVRVIIAVAAVIVLVVLALGAVVGQRAFAAKASLERAQGQLQTFRSAVAQPDQDLPALYEQVRASTEDAVGQSRTPAWSLLEHVPLIGANLEAFRQTTELVDAVVRDGIGPLAMAANGLSAESLKPTDGRIDLAPLQRLAPAVVDVDAAIQAASRSAGAIDTRHVVAPAPRADRGAARSARRGRPPQHRSATGRAAAPGHARGRRAAALPAHVPEQRRGAGQRRQPCLPGPADRGPGRDRPGPAGGFG